MSFRKSCLSFSIAGIFAFGSIGCAARAVYVQSAPPVKRVEVRPAKPFGNAVWIAGYWRLNGRAYVWKAGRWVKPKKGKTWVAGHWKKTRRGYVWVQGRWR